MQLTLSLLNQWLELEQSLVQGPVAAISIDTRTLKKGDVYLAIPGEQFDGHRFCQQAEAKGAVAVIVEHTVDVSIPQLLVRDCRQALGLIAKHYRQQFDIPLVAITGSVGKTTTSHCVASILRESGHTLAPKGSFNNDIGVPLTLLQLNKSQCYGVFECGTNHPGEIDRITDYIQPDVSVVTTVALAHVEGLGSLQAIAEEKAGIYRQTTQHGIVIINRDIEFFDYFCQQASQRQVITFGLHDKADIRASDIALNAHGQPTFILHYGLESVGVHLPMLGKHNVYNALAAAAIAKALDIPLNMVIDGLSHLAGVDGRMQTFNGVAGCTLIDDSYNANPASMKAAIDCLANFPGEKYFIAGDMKELGELAAEFHQQIGLYAKTQQLDKFLTYGTLSQHAAKAFYGDYSHHFASQQALIDYLKPGLHNGLTCLFKGSRSMHMEHIVNALKTSDTLQGQ